MNLLRAISEPRFAALNLSLLAAFLAFALLPLLPALGWLLLPLALVPLARRRWACGI